MFIRRDSPDADVRRGRQFCNAYKDARLRETGSVLPNHLRPGRGLHRRVRDEEEVLREFERNPGNSIRRVADVLGVSRSTIHPILKENGLHPYHYQRLQQLLPGDA